MEKSTRVKTDGSRTAHAVRSSVWPSRISPLERTPIPKSPVLERITQNTNGIHDCRLSKPPGVLDDAAAFLTCQVPSLVE